MLAQVKGIVKGNTVIVEDKYILNYEGKEVVVTFLDYVDRKEHPIRKVDLTRYMGRGKKLIDGDAQEAVRRLRSI